MVAEATVGVMAQVQQVATTAEERAEVGAEEAAKGTMTVNRRASRPRGACGRHLEARG